LLRQAAAVVLKLKPVEEAATRLDLKAGGAAKIAVPKPKLELAEFVAPRALDEFWAPNAKVG